MLIIHVAMAVFALGFVVTLHLLGRRQVKTLRKESKDWWFERRRKDRDDLLDTARLLHQQGGFRAQRPSESSWDYASAFDRWSARQLNMDPTAQWASPVEFERRRVQMPTIKLPNISGLMQQAFDEGYKSVREAIRNLPSGKETYQWSMTMKTFWWSVELDGVVHKGAKLKHDDIETPIAWCDIEKKVEPEQMQEHLQGEGPLVTCFWCSTGIRRK